MNATPQTDDIGATIAAVVQFIGAAVACIGLGVWAWSLAAGSILGFVLLFLLGALFVAPMVAWGLPAVALAAGLIAQGLATLIHWRRSRV